MTKTYTVKVDYMGESKNPISLHLESNGYKREIGFYRMEEFETNEDFVSRQLTTFLETIKNYPESKQAINI